MRIVVTIVASCILALVLPLPTAAAETETEEFGCHSWELYVGDRATGVGASTDEGALFVGASGYYVISDGVPLLMGSLFSVWIYPESNGEAGLQRGDEVCDESNGGEYEPDSGCLC